MAIKTKLLSQPTEDEQRELHAVENDIASYVFVRGKRWKVKYKHNRSLQHVTSLMLDEGEDEDKVICKAVAYLRLDTLFKIKFLFWFLWRWYFYVKDYTAAELVPYIEECKKKVQVAEYYEAIILLTAMKTTKMQMTRAEVERFQAEQLSEQLAASPKTTPN